MPLWGIYRIVSSGKTGNTFEKNYNIFLRFYKTFCLLKNYFGNLNVSFRRFVECRTDNFRIYIPLHISNFFRTFVYKKHYKVDLGMIAGYAVGKSLK